MKTYAEESPYWDTTVSPAKSQGEVIEMLNDFGADAIMVGQGMSSGNYAWLVRFGWLGRSYRFVFQPLPLQYPNRVYTVSKKRLTAADRARQQMGRIALNFVKSILTAAQMNPAALFGFLELPAAYQQQGFPATTAELDVDHLVSTLSILPALPLPPSPREALPEGHVEPRRESGEGRGEVGVRQEDEVDGEISEDGSVSSPLGEG